MPLTMGSGLARPNIVREDRDDGSFVLRSADPLLPYERCVGEWLVYWAARTPDAIFIAQRDEGPDDKRRWQSITYAAALEQARRIGQALIDLAMPTDAPVVALSGNSTNLALLSLGAMHVGRVVATVSSAYSLKAKEHSKLHAMLDQIGAGLIYAEDACAYGPTIDSYNPRCPVVYGAHARAGALSISSLRQSKATAAVDRAFASVRPETAARLLLTSGSTGMAKCVVNTHGMLCANQQMIAQCWPFVDRAQPVVLDWLPWSHTFGANHNFNLVLRNGGTFYIDEGCSTPLQIERTVENLRDVMPTLFFNVPRGYELLLPALEADSEAAEALFRRLDMMMFAGAALPLTTAQRLRRLARRHGGSAVFFTTEWGTTETSPVITNAHFPTDDSHNIGVPVPGLDVKFAPLQDKFEMRVRGPSVFREYRGNPEKTAAAFDEEGFYRTGDAGLLADASDPNRGIVFDGRVAEDFKLTTGTWVSVGTLRLRAISALTPYVHDVVITGHDRDEVGLLLFPSPALYALAACDASQLSGVELGACESIRLVVRKALQALNADGGSSQCPVRALILPSQPSHELGEITDKGYVNQRAVLMLRAAEAEQLYSEHSAVIHVRG
ncbi:AMP-binding protein [Paraburkholderia sp. NMBU_R16]|nr:AMP-binding protein [Paraburkholderia sp. NMBU_R16]